MPVHIKVRTPHPTTPAVSPVRDPRMRNGAEGSDLRGPTARASGSAVEPGASAVARAVAGNATVAAALGGSPPGAGPGPSWWAGQMLPGGQDQIGNQAVAAQAGALPATQQFPSAQQKLPAQQQLTQKPDAKKPEPKPVRKAKAPPAPRPDQKDTKDTTDAEGRPDKGAKKQEAAGPRSPGADPKFQALKKDVAAKKQRVASSHPPPAAEAGAAQGAAVPPADDQEARGKAAHAEDMDAAQPKEFDKQSFITAVEKAIKDRAPKNLDEADKFGESGKAEEVKTEVQGKVGEGKDAAGQEIADTTAATPEPAPDAKEVVPLSADAVPGKPGAPNPNQAAPDALPKSATDMSAGPDQVNQQMASAQVTEQQLSMKNSREPAFDKAVRDKKTMEAHSAAAPKELRAGEATELKKVKATAATSGAAAMGALHATRVATGQQVTTGKQGTKGRDEDKRTKVTALLQKVFDDAKGDVEEILSGLDKKVDAQFTSGEKRARDRFTDEHTRGMDEYKSRRYSGWRGKARWVKDLFADLPEEANRIYERARDNYLTAMRQVISDVADTVEGELHRAKDRIAKGRKDLKHTVDTLPKDLRAIGREAAADFQGKFDELTDTVNDKGTELVDTLATKYTEAVKSVDAEIAAEKEKNKGLVSKAADAIGGVINTIKELGRLLMGVLRKAASAVGLILKDPVGFLGRLITGVGGGLNLFMKNAGRHLQQGVLAWLLGSGVTAGLILPTSFDVLGILVMIAGLLGLSWPNIRARLARKVNPKTMAAAETGKDAIPIVVEAKRRGVAGLWSDLKSRVGDLKKDLISKLVSYLLPTIIIAGVTWIVSLFNPASAFIRACKMIIDIVRFIVTQGRQIIEFVNTVLDAVIAIARGGTGGVPALVERALARSIPVLIGALAAILGIGGIAGKVKQIFQALARPVNRAIDWVIEKITGLLRKLAAKLKPKRKKPERPQDRRKPTRPRRPRKPAKPKRPRKAKKPDRPKNRKRKDRRTDQDKRRALDAAIRDANRLIGAEDATVKSVRKGLPSIKRRHRLKSIRLVKNGELHVIELSINPKGNSDEANLTFPYALGQARDSIELVDVDHAHSTLRAVQNVTEEPHRAAFIVNMIAIPKEVTNNPKVAARYLTDAWASSKTEKPVAAIRTAVIIGVNAAEGLDTNDKERGKQPVVAAINAVDRPRDLLMAVFGFTWTPRWMDTSGKRKRAVSIDTVRARFQGLNKADKEAALAKERAQMRGKKVPFGLLRGKVFNSPYTRDAKGYLSEVNKKVYVLLQDPDSTVSAPGGPGVLAAYDNILKDVKGDPMMIIGGYDFERFDWKRAKTESLTVQLTILSNRIDRAIRFAIGKRHPDVLYPSEPSTLVKVWEAEVLDVFHRLDKQASNTTQKVLPFGIGPSEGHNFRKWLKALFSGDFSVIYDPRASVSTDPKPGSPARRLIRSAQNVINAVKRRGKPAYAIFLQSQTTASAQNLAESLFMKNPKITKAGKGRIQTEIFLHVERVIILMTENPGMTARDPRIRQILHDLANAVNELSGSTLAQRNKDFAKSVALAHELAHDIIFALTSRKLRSTWRKLGRALRQAERQGPKQGTE
ncbi:hypothetical protein [Streptomyces sp. NEAU-S77]|uniref:hypothetical protein n=1 Tax=Streptomyces sp. NEAU-S77 TaxID=3411033 RepID=UPI003BA16417